MITLSPLERAEDVRVSLQAGQQVFRHIAITATGFAHFLDRIRGMRRVGGLQRGGVGFDFPLVGLLFLGQFRAIQPLGFDVVDTFNQVVCGQL